MLDITREIVAEHGLKLRTAVIRSEQSKTYLKELLRQNRIRPARLRRPPLDETTLGAARTSSG